MSRIALTVALLGLCPSATFAQLDPERNKPYQLRIVLDVAKDHHFTPLFQDQLRRGLQDTMQAALGGLAEVEVLTPASVADELNSVEQSVDPKRRESIERVSAVLGKIAEKGLKQGLNEWREISERKTHFVKVTSVDGQFTIQARQFDGLTGLASPVVRIEHTADRALVLRVAGMLIAQDFGVVGTVPAGTSGSEVNLALKAGDLGSLTPWVGKGDVFAIAAIAGQADNFRSNRVPEALLQVIDGPKDGACRCRVLHRYQDPLAAGPAGYRCLKLGTTEAPLTLRLVDDQRRPMGSWRIIVSPAEAGHGPTIDVATRSDGFTRPLGPYRNVALVQVLGHNDTPLIGQIPIEILNDQPVVCHVSIGADAEQAGRFAYDRRRLLGRLDESLRAVSGLRAELNRASEDAKLREEMLQKARTAIGTLANEVIGFKEEVGRLAVVRGLDVGTLRQRIALLEQRQQVFRDYVTKLENVIKEETDPKRQLQQTKWANAGSLESEARFDEAIQLYEEVLKEGGQPQKFAEYLVKLKEKWALRNNDTHPKARKFVYTQWKSLTTAEELSANVVRAHEALQTFMKVDDRLSARMLELANIAHAQTLEKRQAELAQSKQEDDADELQIIAKLGPELAKLAKDTYAFLHPAKEP